MGRCPAVGVDNLPDEVIQPAAERLSIDAELMADPRDRPARASCLRTNLEDHLHSPFPQLIGMRFPRYHQPGPAYHGHLHGPVAPGRPRPASLERLTTPSRVLESASEIAALGPRPPMGSHQARTRPAAC